MTEHELTAYCGDCIRYQSKASDLAKDLLRQFEERQSSAYAKVKRTQMPEFKHYESMIEVLRAVSELKYELPCRLGSDGCGGSCHIVKCVKDKSLEGCWECPEYEICEELDFLTPFHGNTPLNNLGKIREFGIGDWAKHRAKFYPWVK